MLASAERLLDQYIRISALIIIIWAGKKKGKNQKQNYYIATINQIIKRICVCNRSLMIDICVGRQQTK